MHTSAVAQTRCCLFVVELLSILSFNTLLPGWCRFELDVDPEDGWELFSLQVMSLTDVPTADQMLYTNQVAGRLSSPPPAEPTLFREDAEFALMRFSEQYIDIAAFHDLAREGLAPAVDAETAGLAASLVSETCTRVFYGDEALAQPTFGTREGALPFMLCQACAGTCVVQAAPVRVQASTEGPGDGAFRFCCECNARQSGGCLFAPRYGADTALCAGPVGVGMRAHLLQAARKQSAASSLSEVMREGLSRYPSQRAALQGMAERLHSIAGHVRLYQETATLEKARATIPVAVLHARVHASMTEGTNWGKSFPDELLHQLALWFKREFFAWTNNMKCAFCGSTDTQSTGGAAPQGEVSA